MNHQNDNSRVVILLVSGALFTASVGVWMCCSGDRARFARVPAAEDSPSMKISPVVKRLSPRVAATARNVTPTEPRVRLTADSGMKPSTTASIAREARKSTGRLNPMEPVLQSRQGNFGDHALAMPAIATRTRIGQSKIAIPPPPREMPLPYSPPLQRIALSEDMSVVALFDDSVIVGFPKITARKYRLPEILTLRPGDELSGVKLVQVLPDSIVVEEDGEQRMRSLRPIR